MGNAAATTGEFGKKTTSDEVAEMFGNHATGKFVVITGRAKYFLEYC